MNKGNEMIPREIIYKLENFHDLIGWHELSSIHMNKTQKRNDKYQLEQMCTEREAWFKKKMNVICKIIVWNTTIDTL